jgi:hypothetical protein
MTEMNMVEERKRKREETRMQHEEGWDAIYVDEWSDGGNDLKKTYDDTGQQWEVKKDHMMKVAPQRQI